MPNRPVAVLDANVLFPFQLRNFLLHLAVEEVFLPLWSDEIVGECTRALQRDAGLGDEQCAHLLRQMRAAFPDAWGEGYGGRADGIALPDEGDRHVLALAIHYEADFIITRNLRHFPPRTLMRLEIDPLDPDTFCEFLWAIAGRRMLRAAELHRRSLKAHPLSPGDYLESLRTRAGLARTAELLASAGFAAGHALASVTG